MNSLQTNLEMGKALARYVAKDTRGQSGSAMIVVGLVVALFVAALIAGLLLPVGVDELVAVNTTDWSSGAQAMWDVLDILIVLAVFLFFIAIALSASRRV